ncbi:MAG: FAD-binding oxidoreductase, partial [Lewinella sp.]|nr:FAD-binding oxidoreductase [Lewinella sp.]
MAYEQSFWEWNSFFRDIDFLIIGGGIVGLSAGIYLCEQSPGAKVLVLDRGPLPLGASTRNAGFACFGSMTELLADLSQTSAEVVWELVHRRYQGLRTLRQR